MFNRSPSWFRNLFLSFFLLANIYNATIFEGYETKCSMCLIWGSSNHWIILHIREALITIAAVTLVHSCYGTKQDHGLFQCQSYGCHRPPNGIKLINKIHMINTLYAKDAFKWSLSTILLCLKSGWFMCNLHHEGVHSILLSSSNFKFGRRYIHCLFSF